MEIGFGDFYTELELPCAVDADSAEAEYQGGFLKIILPKKMTRNIPIV
jgi:HSP20 family molecular chaperone IbpA